MAAQNTETLLYQVDIQANNARLAELARDVRIAKEEFAKLSAQVKAGAADAALLDTANVKLKQTLATASQETRVLTQANQAQVKVTAAAAGSNEQLRAQLALNTIAYNKLSAEERTGTEAGQALQAQTRAISDALKANESAVGDTRRNVGNYAGAINELIPQLVKLQEQQKAAAPNSAAYQEVTRQIGFVQKAAEDAGAKMGLSAEQTTAKLNTVAAAIRPATAELVKLEGEQVKVEKGSEAYTQIGFKVNKLTKEIAQAPAAIQQVETATDGVKSGLQAAISKGLAPFQNELDRGTGLLGKFKSGSDLVKQGLTSLQPAGETGALGFKAVAAGIALTGIGLFVLAISAVVGYFTQTNEGSKILKQGLAGLGAVVTTVANLFTGAGKAAVEAFKNPKEALNELLDFLKGQVVNRLTAFAVILEGIEKRNFKQVANGIIQLNTGVENGLDKVANYAANVGKVALAAAELEANQQKLKKSRAELEVSEVAEKGRVEELLRLSKDRTLTSQQRLDKLREAGAIENEVSAKSQTQIKAELALLQQRNAAKGLSVTSDEIQEERDKRKELAQTEVERKNILATIQARQSRFILEQRAEEAKASQDAIKERIAATEAELLAVASGSARELELKSLLVRQKAELEQAGERKSAADRKLILATSLAEQLKLDEEFEAKKSAAARKFLDEQLTRDQAALAADKKRKDDAAKEVDDTYKRNERLLDNHFARVRTKTEDDYRDGLLDKKQYDAQLEIQEENRLGAELILLKQFGKDTSKVEEQITKLRGNYLREQTKSEDEVYRERLGHAQQFGEQVGQLFADTLTDTGESLQEFSGKVLILVLNELETYILAQQAKAFARAVATEGPLGLIEAGVEAAAIMVAFEAAKALITSSTASAKPFNTGGQVPGVGNTDSVSAVLTPGEIIMNKSSSQALAPLLSYLNASYGGADFAPGFTPGTTRVAGQIDGGLMARQIGGAQQIDYNQLTKAVERATLYSSPNEMGAALAKKARINAMLSL